jgi:hypothetical protein
MAAGASGVVTVLRDVEVEAMERKDESREEKQAFTTSLYLARGTSEYYLKSAQ